jgi:PPK2 family polyphosphate:nucleotide phosphotransferase
MSLYKFKSIKNKLRPTQKDIEDRYRDNKVKLKKTQKTLADLQSKIQAEKKHSVLIIFQAMDAAGKDSTIRNVFAKCDIAGIDNVSFKQPSKNESAHDFIWRCHQHTPAKGQIVLFNRSYYEEVLVVKVHPQWLASQSINVPIDKHFWNNRYENINNFEKLLQDSGTKVIKFMLDVSQEEQHKRLIRRYKTPEKKWKFSIGDIKESNLWPQYQQAFDDLLTKTSTDINPWYVIPADDKQLMRLLVSEIIIEELKKLSPKYPEPDDFNEEDKKLIDTLLNQK